MILSALFFYPHQTYAEGMSRISQQVRLMVAVSNELKRKLEASASAGKRSLSAEMVLRLEASFEKDDEAVEVRNMVDDHDERIKELERDVARLLDVTGQMTDYR